MSYVESQNQMSSFNNRWRCPYCNVPLRPRDLVCDAFFSGLVSDAGRDHVEVELDPESANWRPLDAAKDCGHSEESDEEEEDGGLPLTSAIQPKQETYVGS